MRRLLPILLAALLLAGCARPAEPAAHGSLVLEAPPSATEIASASPAPTLPVAKDARLVTTVPQEEFGYRFDNMDIDGDGEKDALRLWREQEYRELQIDLRLSGGGKYEMETFCVYFDEIVLGDLTGDGLPELIVMLNTGAAGGMGSCGLFIFSAGEGELARLPMPGNNEEPEAYWDPGYEFTAAYRDGFTMDVAGALFSAEGLPVLDREKEHLITNGTYDKDGRLLKQDESGTDGIYKAEIVDTPDGNALRIRQYVYLGPHVGGIGDGISVLRWEGEAFRLVAQSFEMYD